MESYLLPVEDDENSVSDSLTSGSKRRRCSRPGCTKFSQGPTSLCVAHGGGKLCTSEGCSKVSKGSGYCIFHGGGKRCIVEGCGKSAKGPKGVCVAHGGGRRCRRLECNKLAISNGLCKIHGGGRLCDVEGCNNSRQGRGKKCKRHGGGSKCSFQACTSKDAGRGYCIKHGGGRRCQFTVDGVKCGKSAQGKEGMCRKHTRLSRQSQFGESRKHYSLVTPVSGNKGTSPEQNILQQQDEIAAQDTYDFDSDFYLCCVDDCQNLALTGGRCEKHSVLNKCSFKDCKKVAVLDGNCYSHVYDLVEMHRNISRNDTNKLLDSFILCLARRETNLKRKMSELTKTTESCMARKRQLRMT